MDSQKLSWKIGFAIAALSTLPGVEQDVKKLKTLKQDTLVGEDIQYMRTCLNRHVCW